MIMLMGKSCRALFAEALPCCCFVGVFSLSTSRHEPFLRSASLG
jgi:hypothetical protein